MASKTNIITLPVDANQAYGLVRQAGSEIRGFSLKQENPQLYSMRFARGFGWTNPVDVEISVYQQGGQTCVQLKADIVALADPMGFLPPVLNVFETHIHNHVHALQTGQPVAPAPRERRGMTVTLWIFGAVGAMFLLLILCAVIASAR